MKVGDRIVVSHNIVNNDTVTHMIHKNMRWYAGEVGTIVEKYKDKPFYRISVDDMAWWWHEDTLILLEGDDGGR